MMKPEPSEVTCRGAFGLGPRKFLNRSSSGEPGGSCGIAFCVGAFKVWLVEMFTTVGSSLSARSAKESGAGRAETAEGKLSARIAQARMERKREGMSGSGGEESGGILGSPVRNKQGKKAQKPAAGGFLPFMLLQRFQPQLMKTALSVRPSQRASRKAVIGIKAATRRALGFPPGGGYIPRDDITR